MGGDRFLQLDVMNLVPSFSWRQKYFQTMIFSCKVDDLILDQLFISASVIMFFPLVLCRSFLFVTWLVPLAPWFGVSLSLPPGVEILILVCVSLFFFGGGHVYVMSLPLLIFIKYACDIGIACFVFSQ